MSNNGGQAITEHLVQLFDSGESLSDTVSAFLCTGLLRGSTVLAVLNRPHWVSVAARLRRQWACFDDAIRSGQLTMRDAAETMSLFMRNGRPDRDLFARSVGRVVRKLASRGKPLWIYGEMVDLLAQQGEYRGAEQLEQLWNEFGRQRPFTLFCGYSAENFGNPRHADSLRAICRSHSHVRSNPRDLLSVFLLEPHITSSASAL